MKWLIDRIYRAEAYCAAEPLIVWGVTFASGFGLGWILGMCK